MRRTELLQETRKMRFEELYSCWNEGRLTQEQAALVLGVCDRTFRRYINRYEDGGVEGLSDKRLTQASHRRAPVDEVMEVAETYRLHHRGWNVKHYHSWYRRAGGLRSYSWVKNTPQSRGLVVTSPKRGSHRIRRERAHLPGVMIHQDGSRHEGVPGCQWDLIVTMDDATGEHYSMFFVDQEGTDSSFQGVRDVIMQRGLFSSFYSDRASHYWYTPKEGGKVSKTQLTQFGRAMKQLGILMIPTYSPAARGRGERAFGTHQGRLVKDLALQGIRDMTDANHYLERVYRPNYNAEFMQPAPEEGAAFVPWAGGKLEDILCYQEERTVGTDNCVSFDGKLLQIPRDPYRCHYVRVRVHRYSDGTLALFHGPRKLADYDAEGTLLLGEKAA